MQQGGEDSQVFQRLRPTFSDSGRLKWRPYVGKCVQWMQHTVKIQKNHAPTGLLKLRCEEMATHERRALKR